MDDICYTYFGLFIRTCKAPVAQAGTESTDVIWEVWEVFDHSSLICAYLLGRYCTANGGVNDMSHAMGCICV